MENCDYIPISTEENVQKNGKTSFYRQLFICTGTMSFYFVTGMYFGAPTVTIAQIRREANSTAAISFKMASWLSSVHGYSALPWIIILAILSELYGRKKCFIFVTITMILGYLMFCFSTTVNHILISEIIIGISLAGCQVVSVVVVSEYTSPQYRGVFLAIKSAMFSWGVWAANAIGTFVHWKYIGVCALVCSAYTLTSFMWPESPHWLAAKGRFDECATAHRWLKGVSDKSEDELKKMIIYQKDHLRNHQRKISVWIRIMNVSKTFFSKSFYKPVLCAELVILLYQFSGKLAITMYAIEIIKKIVLDESTAYTGMLILDGVSVAAMYFGCYLSKILNRRIMLFTSTSIGFLSLCAMSLYLYLIKLTYIHENIIVSLLLLIIYSLSMSCGPMLLSSGIYVELLPYRYKTRGLIIVNLLNFAVLSTILILVPLIVSSFGLHIAFLLFAISVFIILLILFKYLPETKDKTLQEIEQYFER